MLSAPFRSVPRRALWLLLVLLIAIEAASGAGLYVNNRTINAAPSATPTPGYPTGGPGELKIQNKPRTVMVGQVETFSIKMGRLPNQPITFTITYPDGNTVPFRTITDRTGYAKISVRVKYIPKGKRAPIGVAVYYSDKQQAFTDFAVQLPKAKK